ncbi:MAG TPA: hypothetical protein VEJ89_15930 [Myxococcaceae bacterium]|jgi:rod shape-determining protein MreD|nr:hypothetical protein [Myxococcaceae bacterium]
MRVLFAVGLALLLLSVESVVVKYLGLTLARIDVTVAIVAFLSLRSGLLEGAAGAFAVGYLLDLMSGRPTGLYTFLAVLTFLLGRIARSLVEVRGALGFAVFALAADAVHGLLALAVTWLTSKTWGMGALSPAGLPLEVLLTGAAALCLYPVLQRFGPVAERAEPGLIELHR